MSDMMPMGGMPQPQAPAQGEPTPSDVVESNRSLLNETDALTMMGRSTLTPETTLGEFLGQMGMDVNAPALPQLQRFAKAQLGNQDPLSKMQNIAQGNNVQPGAGDRAAQQLAQANPAMQPGATPVPNGVEGLLQNLR